MRLGLNSIYSEYQRSDNVLMINVVCSTHLDFLICGNNLISSSKVFVFI